MHTHEFQNTHTQQYISYQSCTGLPQEGHSVVCVLESLGECLCDRRCSNYFELRNLWACQPTSTYIHHCSVRLLCQEHRHTQMHTDTHRRQGPTCIQSTQPFLHLQSCPKPMVKGTSPWYKLLQESTCVLIQPAHAVYEVNLLFLAASHHAQDKWPTNG